MFPFLPLPLFNSHLCQHGVWKKCTIFKKGTQFKFTTAATVLCVYASVKSKPVHKWGGQKLDQWLQLLLTGLI